MAKHQLHSKLVKGCIEYLTAIGCVCFPYRAIRMVMSKDKTINAMKDGQLGTKTIKGKPIFAKASGQQGISDIVGFMKDGRGICVECKIPPDKLKPIQKAFLERVARNKVVALVVESIDELIKEMDKIRLEFMQIDIKEV